MRIFPCAILAFLSSIMAVSAEPAITSGQIENDWLRQNELRCRPPIPLGTARPEEDAVGGCDGVKNGTWGFHTQNEDQPWWQVDLGQATPLDRIVLFNRCDGCAARNNRILVLLSNDANAWEQAYQHDGTTFYGHSGGKPLTVPLAGRKARYVRLQLPGKGYFHLDEVETYAGDGKNIALGKPATQSSTSPWSVRHALEEPKTEYATVTIIERGLQLAGQLRELGVVVEPHEDQLRQLSRRLEQLAADAPDDARRQVFFDAHKAVRRLALSNPLLDFDTILLVKRAPPLFPHMSDQYYGWWSRPGGGMWLMSGFKSDQPEIRSITSGWPDGTFLRPDLSYDGTKVLFAYCRYYPEVAALEKVDKDTLPEDCFFKIYEMNLDGSGVRQLTHGRYDDFDARYLPGGEIVFLSTRKGQFLQCNKAGAEATRRATLPDSFVRCGGGDMRPVAVYTLHVMDGDGGNLRAISAFENFEWNPAVAHDGRVLYARWDYIDRFNGHYESLWSTNPDGTNPQLVYGNFTDKPQCVFEARPIPASQKLVFVAAAHHSNEGGSLCLLDRAAGSEGSAPITRLTPEVCFPETEGWPEHFYANPYPLSEQFFLVSWSDRKLPPHSLLKIDDPRNPTNAQGLYLYDTFGNLEMLYRDPLISSMYPLPVRPRPKPAVTASIVDWDGVQEGRFLLQDVYEGLDGVPRSAVKRIRIVAVPPKTQPQMNQPVLGVSREDPGKFVLGTAPVAEDGSAWFRVPSGVPLFFQALDADGLALQTMRTLTYVQPGQTLACVGCHESRDTAPQPRRAALAALGEPSRLTPGPPGTWPLRFDELVQPVLDRYCVECHRQGAENAKAIAFDLTAAKAYDSLIGYAGEDLKTLAFEKPRSEIGDCPARKSKLLALLSDGEGHEGVRLDAESRERLVTWMDTYAQRLGSFSAEQEQQLRDFRREMAALLAE
ncbi:MAG: hypothetical protein GXY83_40860 [Rhodopirellula sp.]|nr:hypothetical protein [Rhodopirellula sp.]